MHAGRLAGVALNMLEKLLWATGSIGVHAAMVAVALAPPTVVPAGMAAQAVPIRLLAEVPARRAPASVVLFAEAMPVAMPPDTLLAESELRPTAVATASPLTSYLPSSAMERRPMPVSEPDVAGIRTDTSSGLPVRLRIYIDRLGNVVSVVPLVAAEADAAFVMALTRMFRATAFLPGQRGGVDVGSYMDIELVAK